MLLLFLSLLHMSHHWQEDTDAPRRKAADWAKLAQQRLEELRAEGRTDLKSVANSTRKLAKNFWATAWMRQLAYCAQEGANLAAGRSLLRHGCVLDLKLEGTRIHALISGEDIYELEMSLPPLDEERLEPLRELFRLRIDAWMSLLDGKLDESVMQLLCEPETGILPRASDWKMHCSCPSWDSPCSHAAAAMYALGCLIDEDSALLFNLLGIDAELLCPREDEETSFPTGKGIQEIDSDSIAGIFGIQLDD